MNGRRIASAIWLGASLATIAISTRPVLAQERAATAGGVQSFDLPALSAAEALDRFARQTRFPLVYAADAVVGVRTNAVRGSFTPIQALGIMLEGTGLTAVPTAGGGVTIRRTLLTNSDPQSEVSKEPPEPILVIGTRLDDRFAGASPGQAIDAQVARESGLLDTGTILRNSPQVSGPRSQLRYNSESSAGGATREGPGAQTIALRGFNPEQTLVLVNGRRLVSSGTEGVPAAPDIGLIPQIIVSRYEILTEGASPTYGSDAIAGIVNIKLQEDFDGLRAFGTVNIPERGGVERLGAVSWGKTWDNGYLGLAGEYRRSDGLKVRDAYQFGVNCGTQYTRGPNGEIRTDDLLDAQLLGTSLSPCNTQVSNRFVGRFVTSQAFDYFATPGRTNSGVPGFTAGPLPLGFDTRLDGLNPTPYDADGDGVIDAAFDSFFLDPDGDGLAGFDRKADTYDSTRGPLAEQADFIAPVEQFNIYSHGKLETAVLGDASLFFEAGLARRSSTSQSIGANTNPLFFGNGIVPETNPTNPCGIETPNCVSLQSEIDDQGNETVFYGTGLPQLVGVFYRLQGDNDRVSSSVNQYRAVVGIEGNLELLNDAGPAWLGSTGWTYSLAGIYSRSEGRSSRRGILRDRMELSLASTVRDPRTGELVCGFDTDGDGIPDPTTPAPGAARNLSDCVPVNLFTEGAMIDRRLSPLEESYVFGELNYRTDVELLSLTGIVKGSLGRLPAGPISVVAGGEFRHDSVDVSSTPEGAASNFLTFYAAIPGGAKGSRRLLEAFGEVGVPLLRDLPLIYKLDVSAAGRLVDDEFAGQSSVYTVRGRWDVTDWLALRSTYGTAYRSPGLVELFQTPNTQEALVGDACFVPPSALAPDGSYIPSGEIRSPLNLDRCRQQGVDPTTLGSGVSFEDFPRTRLIQGGAQIALRPETSTSLTTGFVAQLPLNKVFPGRFGGTKVNVSATYYELAVKDIITIGDVGTVFLECFGREAGQDYCDRITRRNDGFIEEVRVDFVNRDRRSTRGIDFNLVWDQSFNIRDLPFRFTFDLAGNYELSNRLRIRDTAIQQSGTPLFPKLKMFTTFRLRQGNFGATWFTNYIGSSQLSEEARPDPVQIRTCLPPERERCSFINEVDDYFLHNASITWQPGKLAVSVGINNVFNTAPPRVGVNGVEAGITNTLLNGNYSLFGRSFVLQVQRQF
jgi:iron complex outermembrane receptor protein